MQLYFSIPLSIFGALFIIGWLFALVEWHEEEGTDIVVAIMSLLTGFLVLAGLIFGAIQLLI